VQRSFKFLRISLFIALLIFGLTKCRELYDKLKNVEFNFLKFIIIILFVVLSFIIQAWLTKIITKFCDAKIKIPEALQINVIGGLFGVLMPFGSVAYKAVYLKKHQGIEMMKYSSFYGLSFSAACFASVIILMFAGLYYGESSIWILSILILSAILLFVIFLDKIFNSFPRIKDANVFKSFMSEKRYMYFFQFTGLHFFGLLNYVLIYQACFYFLSLTVPIIQSCALVAIQNIIFLAPVVPGNLVVLESIAAWLMSVNNMNPYDIVLAVLLMRFTMMFSLIVLAIPFYFKGALKELREK
jgi:uncharacterized membrane protein YbhN (UPF0104 family)